MADRFLFDTDILIQYFRDDPHAVQFLERSDAAFLISTMTVAELYTGARTAEEVTTIDHFIFGFDVIPVSEDIARRGGLLRQKYHPSHGTGLADALIAATALQSKASLVTFNTKHYPMLEYIFVPYSR